jgi:hypothetical protein
VQFLSCNVNRWCIFILPFRGMVHSSSFYSEGGMHNCFYMDVGAFFLMHSSSLQVEVGAFFILPCGNRVHYSSILLQ